MTPSTEAGMTINWKDGFDKGRDQGLEEAAKKADAIASQVGSSPNHKIIIGTAEIIAVNIRNLKTTMPDSKHGERRPK